MKRPAFTALRRVPAYRYSRIRIKELAAGRPFSRLGIVHIELPPHYTHVPLYHARTKEWMYILSGEGRAVIGGRSVRLTEGMIVYMPPVTIHRMGTGRRPVEALVLFSPPLDPRKRGADICFPR